MVKRLIALFAVLAMSVIPSNGSFAGDSGRVKTKLIRLGDLDLHATERSADEDYLLMFSSHEQVLVTSECAFKTHEPRIVPGTPLPNCSSLLSYCFSGGAHCCTTLFIATQCGSRTSLDMIDLGHSDKEVKFIQSAGSPVRTLRVFDWQFAYYTPENSQIQLSFASSPAMTRLLVFENGHWRPDRAGEFSAFYSRLLRETTHSARISARQEDPELTASRAIRAAYYGLMAGKQLGETTENLSQLLPPKWKSESGNVIQDVSRAVYGFNPVDEIK